MNDDHVLVQQVANDIWTSCDYERNARESMVRRSSTSSEEDLMALALRTKPQFNAWLSPRVCTMREDVFEHAPTVIEEIYAYLKDLLIEREQAGGMMLQLMQDVSTMSLDKFQADFLATSTLYEI